MNIAVANVDGTIDKENELVRQAAAKLGFFQSFALDKKTRARASF